MSASSDAPVPAGASGPGGAIYDIGYRGYDGPRLGRRAGVTTLLVHTLRGAFGLGRTARAKIAPVLLLAALSIPAIIMVGVVSFVDLDELPVDYGTYLLNAQLVHIIWLAVLAPFAISRDLRFRATTLYFSRPIERMDYLLAKLVATVGALLVMMLVPILVLFLGAMLARLDVSDELSDLGRALTYALLSALLLAVVGLLIASLAPRRGMGTAAIVAVLLVVSAASGIVGEIGRETNNEALAKYSSAASPTELSGKVVAGLYDRSISGGRVPDASETAVFGAAYLVLLLGVGGLLVLRYRKVSVL